MVKEKYSRLVNVVRFTTPPLNVVDVLLLVLREFKAKGNSKRDLQNGFSNRTPSSDQILSFKIHTLCALLTCTSSSDVGHTTASGARRSWPDRSDQISERPCPAPCLARSCLENETWSAI